jgi:hypothetical protein
MEQYSPEWWDIRMGIPTASRASEIITAAKGELSTQSRKYIHELCAESLGLSDPPIEPTEWMLRGLELEDEARRFFTFETGKKTRHVGFLTNDEATAGASADALAFDAEPFDDDGILYPDDLAGLEIKCPKPSTHIGYLLNPGLPDSYKQQVHFSLAVTDLPVWYWMSYHPELDPVIIEVRPDEYTEKVKAALVEFTKRRLAAMAKLEIIENR